MITGGDGNTTARMVAIRNGEMINTRALTQYSVTVVPVAGLEFCPRHVGSFDLFYFARLSVRMKRYWAERRQKNDSPKPGPGRPKASGKRKGISAAGRAAIAAAQKKRWAAIRKAKKVGSTLKVEGS